MDYIVKIYKDWKLHSQFHEIVPEMDEDFVFNETQSIRDSARPLKKYGSTCYNQSLRNNETLLRHEVKKTDTLQGIALKYGCTTEQIRRANRLFASDSLFLRQFLLIPAKKTLIITEEPFDENNGTEIFSDLSWDKPISRVPSSLSTTSVFSSSNTSSESFSNHTQTTVVTHPLQLKTDLSSSNGQNVMLPTVLMTNDNSKSENNSNHNKHSKSLDSMASISISPDEENRRCINEFLSKIDNTISESRKYVERSKEIMMASQSDGDLFTINNHTSYNNSNKIIRKNIYDVPQSSQQQMQNMRYNSNYSNISDTTHLLNTNQMRHVQNSLKRLEQQQDEFFEL